MCFVSVVMALVLPAKNINIAFAQDVVGQTLISTNISSEELQNIYGAEEHSSLSTFTPFDYELGIRMAGKSISPNASSDATFNTVRYNLLDNGGLNITENRLAFGMWIYFSNTNVHSLDVKIAVDESNYYRVIVARNELTNILKKTEGVTEPGFAWNYLEFPIVDNCITGSVTEADGSLKTFSYMEIGYTHANIDAEVTYSRIRLFGLEIKSTDNFSVAATIKQDYYIYSFNFWNDSALNSLVQTDSLIIPHLSEAVNYAWVGEQNLLETAVDWRIEIIAPSGSEKTYTFSSSNNNIQLDESGEYRAVFRAYKENDDLTIDLYDYIRFYVFSNNLVYFNFPSYTLNLDGEKILTLSVSQLLDMGSLETISIESSSENVLVYETENPLEFKIKGVKAGSSEITIKILAKRNTNNSEPIEYTASTMVDVEKNSSGNNVYIIVIVSLLGAVLIVSSIIGIKSLVKSRKNGVK